MPELVDEIVIAGMKLAVKKGGYTVGYMEEILKEWADAKLVSMEQVSEFEKQKAENKRNTMPFSKRDVSSNVFDQLRRGRHDDTGRIDQIAGNEQGSLSEVRNDEVEGKNFNPGPAADGICRGDGQADGFYCQIPLCTDHAEIAVHPKHENAYLQEVKISEKEAAAVPEETKKRLEHRCWSWCFRRNMDRL